MVIVSWAGWSENENYTITDDAKINFYFYNLGIAKIEINDHTFAHAM